MKVAHDNSRPRRGRSHSTEPEAETAAQGRGRVQTRPSRIGSKRAIGSRL